MLKSYIERRRPDRYKLFSIANLRIGDQSLTNRAGSVMNELDFDWTLGLSDDQITREPKETFWYGQASGCRVFFDGVRARSVKDRNPSFSSSVMPTSLMFH